ncbi:MAG: D-alanyl-D-alanine dipeptidase [Rhodospirillaceae bacterium]|nr:D-alanyl-D-alanine dipeptidase [Rhodospirillaceae bacterium]|tara:strand:- start:26665 stop:27225 length:561 start_codon:yes stop_codon:yes gene_type:complete
MDLVEIAPPEYDVDIELLYATDGNFTGKPVYKTPICYLHKDAADALKKTIIYAAELDFRIRIYDAFRPSEAQWVLWDHTPDPDFLADPRRGSPHSRGTAIDLTLITAEGQPLEMGTGFDAFTPRSHHGNTDISKIAQQNRLILLGIMTLAGWDFYRNEWWHYQLFDSRNFPLVSDKEVPNPMMPPS